MTDLKRLAFDTHRLADPEDGRLHAAIDALAATGEEAEKLSNQRRETNRRLSAGVGALTRQNEALRKALRSIEAKLNDAIREHGLCERNVRESRTIAQDALMWDEETP